MSSAAQDEFNELMREKGTENRHPEDRNNDSDNASDNDDSGREQHYEKQDTDDELDIPKDMRAAYTLPNIRSEANTGPKGVIADAHAFEQARKQARRFTWRKAERQQSPDTARHWNEKSASEDEESEEGFLQKWREARLKELHNAGERIRSRTTSPARRIYGDFPAVDGEGYLEAIEKVARDTVVVVFIYDDMSEMSATVEHYMLQVAKRNDSVRFVKLHYEDAEMEVAGVPAVLAYRNADKFAGLVPLLDELPEDSELSAVSLETVFRRHRILN